MTKKAVFNFIDTILKKNKTKTKTFHASPDMTPPPTLRNSLSYI